MPTVFSTTLFLRGIALSHLWHATVPPPPFPAWIGIGIGIGSWITRAQRNDADARLAAALEEQRTMRDKLAAADAAVLEFKGKFDAMAAVLPPGLLQ